MSDEPYVVWSNEHKAWWAPHSNGYCAKLSDAGHYLRDEALQICRDASIIGVAYGTNPNEICMPLKDAEAWWPERP